MGRIYEAEQLPLGRRVALKVLAPTDLGGEDETTFRRRFEREAAICAKLTHSNTVRIFDHGCTSEGIYYIAMEYVDGRTLHQAIKAEAPLHPGRVVHILRQICGSLGEAHGQGIVHRDLKPGNVLLTELGDDRDFVKVVDFGLVKHVHDHEITQAGLIVGSPMYMSPEQVRGDPVDHRTDLYALGTIAYVCLTGKRPFERENAVGMLMARMTARPPPFREIAPDVRGIPPSLEWVVMTAMQADRVHRFETVYEMLRALKVCDAEIRGVRAPTRLSLDQGRTVMPDPDASTGSRSARLAVPVLALAATLGLALMAAAAGLGAILFAATRDGAAPIEATIAPAAVETPVVEIRPPAPPEPVVAATPEVAAAPAPVAKRPVRAKPAKPEPVVEASPPTPAPELPVAPEKDEWKIESDLKNPFD
jgi:serine/threonine-protein kinase